LRRIVTPLAVAAALATAVPAAASLQPVRRDAEHPRVRAGTIAIPPAHRRGRVRVIVRLAQPPLAAARSGYTAAGTQRRLSFAAASSRAYLAQLARSQAAATAALRRAIPEATFSRSFRVLLNGLTVELPATRLPTLARLGFVTKVYPSIRYSVTLNRSPALMSVPQYIAATGARGTGIKIGVVDDGVDPSNPFFAPDGLQYPPGFPKGGRRWTSPKVIVARAFPGPGSGRRGRLAVDPRASFHGTHVAGIAAGKAGTTTTGGRDHPPITGLTGIAPNAWIGNYRVFNVPTSIGNTAQTPEIVAAFESAVRDGMNVINFSGGGPMTDPANDALVEAVANVSAAGVVPVISAGNDRDDFGMGSVGAPGVAPDAIAVAALSNTHTFGPTLTVGGRLFNFVPGGGELPPAAWGTSDRTLVDVGSIVGRDGKPVDRQLCASGDDPNAPTNQLPRGSLSGAIALVSRGRCAIVTKALRAQDAGAIGLVMVDNRAGEANGIPVRMPIPSGTVADLDGADIRALLGGRGGRAPARIGREPLQHDNGRGGVVTSFSSGGPTAFGHQLKPDVGAPGGAILSSTLPAFGGPFAVFDGTSMAAPHVAGAAALLLQRHPTWSARAVKSALVNTAGPAWQDTARTQEASVLLSGSGLVNVLAADSPLVFADPVSLSFGDLNVRAGAKRVARLLSLSDAGGGSGTWTVEVRPQAASSGAALETPAVVTVPPGGTVQVGLAASATSTAAAGDDYGFLILRKGAAVRRIPYAFFVTRPGLGALTPRKLARLQLGSTARGFSNVSVYRWPAFPFRPPPDYVGKPMDEKGAETLYVLRVNNAVANAGVAVVAAGRGTAIHPWLLGSQDENDVQGYPGTPVNVNALTFGYQVDAGAAGLLFPRRGRYFVALDSGSDEYTGRSFAGPYLLRSWQNDVRPPAIRLLTTRVAAGRSLIAARVTDRGAGVDPISLVIGYRQALVGAAAYDPFSGLALFPIPDAAPTLRAARTRAVLLASDFQEAKNVDQAGANVLPNTRFKATRVRVVRGPALTWLAPGARTCAARREPLLVAASSTARLRSVRFYDGRRGIATVRRGVAGLYSATWRTTKARKGRHVLRAIVLDRNGRTYSARRVVRVCRRR
jgi:minor extracellular serine protease Vpr